MAQIHIRKIRKRTVGNTCIVSACVAGDAVWFSAENIDLATSPEAFLSAFLIPAQLRKDRLVAQTPVCETWLKNTTELSVITNGWWQRKVKPTEVPIKEPARRKRFFRKTALFFTAGVDSFHTLFRHPRRIHGLVNVHGFDIALENETRQREAEASYRAVARSRRIPLIQIRTNLREHPYFSKTNWNFTHGGAMAGVAHLLGSTYQNFLLSSSTRRDDPRIWGSTWQIDPLWSSYTTNFSSWGEHLSRAEKMEEIADMPLVRDHLRVCWQSKDAAANCGICPKCTRTMVSLAWAGKLEGLKHRFVMNPWLPEVVATWKSTPILSIAELDPVLRDPERLPDPLRSAVIAHREKLLADLEARLARARSLEAELPSPRARPTAELGGVTYSHEKSTSL